MYDKLIEKLRDDSMLENCEFDFVHKYMHEAADAVATFQMEHPENGGYVRLEMPKESES